jgi:hypothetical protein
MHGLHGYPYYLLGLFEVGGWEHTFERIPQNYIVNSLAEHNENGWKYFISQAYSYSCYQQQQKRKTAKYYGANLGVKSTFDLYYSNWYVWAMSRPLRIDYPNAWHHVMNRARGGTALFIDKADSQ